MSRNLIIAVVAGAVVIGAGAAGLVLLKDNGNDSSNSNSSQTSSKTNESTNNEAVEKASISTLLEKGATQKCSFSSKTDTTVVEGTMYFSNKRMRGDYSSISNGATNKGSMLIVDNIQYYWGSDAKKGVKINLSQLSQNTDSQSSSKSGLDTKKDFDFTCEKWNVDESKFVVPTDVEFTDLTQLQSQLSNGL